MEEEVKTETTAKPTETPSEAKPGDAQEQAREKKYVPLDELIKERQKRRSLEDRLEAVERRMSESAPNNAVKDISSELGVDEESAKKLHAVLSKYSGNGQKANEELVMLDAKFRTRVGEVAGSFEDWDEMKPEMEKILQERYQVDPKRALSEDPENYYYQAVARKSLEEKRQNKLKQESKEKKESQNLASVERGGTPSRPPSKNVWTREKIRELSPSDYEKHRSEIERAIARGEVS